jgi:CheY-like chemotaxis protein
MAKILVADDYPLTVEMLENLLTELGHQVISTTDGIYVETLIQKENPDLLILDVYMPEMDGIQTISAVKAKWPDLPVISVTGGGQSGHDYSEIMEALGAVAYLTKPLNTSKLISEIDNALAARH